MQAVLRKTLHDVDNTDYTLAGKRSYHCVLEICPKNHSRMASRSPAQSRRSQLALDVQQWPLICNRCTESTNDTLGRVGFWLLKSSFRDDSDFGSSSWSGGILQIAGDGSHADHPCPWFQVSSMKILETTEGFPGLQTGIFCRPGEGCRPPHPTCSNQTTIRALPATVFADSRCFQSTTFRAICSLGSGCQSGALWS